MAYITQEYTKGENLETFTLNDLMNNELSDQWKWSHRTLVGYRKEDGTIINPGDIVNYDTETATVSGVWQLDKEDIPINIYLLGTEGDVTVKVHEYNRELPLADFYHPYNNTQSTRETSSLYVYWQGNDPGYVSVEIIPDDGTNIKSIKWLGNDRSVDERLIVETNWPFGLTNAQYGLSVDYGIRGILSYIPNKNYVNQ